MMNIYQEIMTHNDTNYVGKLYSNSRRSRLYMTAWVVSYENYNATELNSYIIHVYRHTIQLYTCSSLFCRGFTG